MAKRREPLNAVQKLYLGRRDAEKGRPPNDDEFMTAFPALWEMLTVQWLDDTHRVDPARLTIQVASGDWLFKIDSPTLRASKSILTNVYAAGLRDLDMLVADASKPWSYYLKRVAKVKETKPEKDGLTFTDD